MRPIALSMPYAPPRPSAPPQPAGQPGHRRTAGQAERDPEQHRADRRKQKAAADPAGRLEADHLSPAMRDHRQEQDRPEPEQQEQRIAGVSAAAAQPIARRAARGGAERRVVRAVGGERDRSGEADADQQRAPGP